MIFHETPLVGAFIITLDKRQDDRWFFARTWCTKEFEQNGIYDLPLQTNMSYTKFKWTLRWLHYQVYPHQESKLVRCTRWAVYDVIIDLRKDSETFMKWYWVILSDENHISVYIPRWFAHWFLTLTDDVEFIYQVSEYYSPECERGIRYNDLSFDIQWPEEILHISDKDIQHPNFTYNI